MAGGTGPGDAANNIRTLLGSSPPSPPNIPPKAMAMLKGMVPKGSQLAGLGILGAGLPALLEFTDDDPVAKNTLQAGGRLAGSLGLGAAGAVLGQMIIPIPGVGALVGGTLAGALGSEVGAGALGGVYDAFAGSDADRARAEEAKNVRQQTELALERLQALGPVQNQIAALADARAVDMARRNMEIQRDYNFGNTLDAASLLGQQQHANQMLMNQQTLY